MIPIPSLKLKHSPRLMTSQAGSPPAVLRFARQPRKRTLQQLRLQRVLSNDAIFHASQDLHLKTKRFPALFPGPVGAQNQSIKTPPGFTTTGKFMIVVLDEGNIVFEGNETNNYLVIGPLP